MGFSKLRKKSRTYNGKFPAGDYIGGAEGEERERLPVTIFSKVNKASCITWDWMDALMTVQAGGRRLLLLALHLFSANKLICNISSEDKVTFVSQSLTPLDVSSIYRHND